jgi:hypothetical protein
MKTRANHHGRWMFLAAAAGAMTGCSSGPQQWDAGAVSQGTDRSGLVFETTEVRLSQGGDLLPFERWEFARNDAATNISRPVALAASRVWPQPPRPAERRIRFSDWQQR